jgi:hypothetical protein
VGRRQVLRYSSALVALLLQCLLRPSNPVPMESPLEQVTRALMAKHTENPLSGQSVRQWMNCSELEVMGAVFKLLHKPEHYNRIEPPLAFEDYQEFHLTYYERCLRENPDGVWCDSRYLAAHSLVAWFKGLWNDNAVPRDALRQLKSLLACLCRDGDEKLRVAVITGALEHLFNDRTIVRFFADWKDDAQLKAAYFEALGYADTERN